MRLLFLLPLLGVVFCAPVPDDQQERKLVKRDDEELVFGNQQNPPKVADAIAQSAAEDAKGSVHADKPKEVSDEAPSEDAKDKDVSDDDSGKIEKELADVVKEEQSENSLKDDSLEQTELESTDSKSADEGNQGDDVSEPVDQSEAEIPVVDSDIVELENIGENQGNDDSNVNREMIVPISEEEMGGTQGQNDALENEMENYYETPYNADDYKQYEMYQNFLSEYPSLLNNYPYRSILPMIGSRRRRAAGRLLARLRGKEVKRSHRTKRDLPFVEDDLYFNPYYFPETDISENPYSGYEGYYETPEEILTYPELEAAEGSYEKRSYPYDDVQEIMYEGEPGYFVPTKRQDMLSFVPGNKRDNYFYPQSEEPRTHFGAFVPEKRDYMDTYSRLVRLARALAMQPEGRDGLLRGYEWE